jgi:hypothetical protein
MTSDPGRAPAEKGGPRPDAAKSGAACVVQCLYLHSPGESFSYPSSRSSGSAARLAGRYLECVLVQSASLRWAAPDAELVLVTNPISSSSLTRRGRALLDRIMSFGVTLVAAEYRHKPRREVSRFAASRYVFDAIDAVAPGRDPDQKLWLVDLDCVWINPHVAFAEVAARRGASALQIGYPPGWKAAGRTRDELGAIGARVGACAPLPPWIGGEVLAGSAEELVQLVRACERLDQELEELGEFLDTEEHLLTIAGGLGRVEFHNLDTVVGRIWTGRRHGAANPSEPEALPLWHLPSEKGLGFRRAANALLRGDGARLREDLSSPTRAAARFNVAGSHWTRAVRDDTWIAAARVRDALVREA